MQKKTEGLTKKQEEILAYIRSFMLEHQYPPTMREICKGVGLRSASSVVAHLKELERKGKIRTEKDSPRAMVVEGMHYVYEEKK